MNGSSHGVTFIQSQQQHRGIEEKSTNSQTGLRFKVNLEHCHYHLFDELLKHKVEVQ